MRSSAGAESPQIDWVQMARTRPRARRTDPATSHEAAEFVGATGSAAAQCGFALAAVRAFPGCTSQELASKVDGDRYMLARRLPELRDDRLVRNDGDGARTCKITGRSALTWWPI